MLRRVEGRGDLGTTIARGQLRLEVERQEAFWGGTRVHLTVSEFAVLVALAERPESVHSREMLLRAIHGFDPATSERVIDAHVKEIRRKLRRVDAAADPIETVPSVGYRIRDDR